MEKVLGPTVSVSTSGMYVYGYSTDSVSGTAGYCYNQSTSPGSYSTVSATQSQYSAPSKKITTSGYWYFHAKDMAGNRTYYKYHCNYCSQDLDSIHYNCSSHYRYNSCTTYSSTCSYSTGTKCSGTLNRTRSMGTTKTGCPTHGPNTLCNMLDWYCSTCGQTGLVWIVCQQCNTVCTSYGNGTARGKLS